MSARVCSQIYIELSGGLSDPIPGTYLSPRPLGTIGAGGVTPTGSVTFRSEQYCHGANMCITLPNITCTSKNIYSSDTVVLELDPEISTARGYGSLKQKPSFNCVKFQHS
ncbi:hypothetical protein T03_15092 [Trichinella britovi]|uniref:Uncharacterized protein n=1 Tax=Trichinella britovi TaxID=45882 RepID=A0A0V1DHN0_TRIBR|nr:hypothetical protein T03_15092 [Trichinella britovi]